MVRVKHILTLALLIVSSIGISQVKFEAKVSKNTLGINERLRIDFQMNKDGDNFKAPDFKNFKVIGGPSTSVSQSWINGKSTFSKTYSYYLIPINKGKFTISPATIEIDQKMYKTQSINITVTTAKAGNNNAVSSRNPSKTNTNKDLDEIVAKNVHLVAEISKSNPYVNEAITLVYKLYVNSELGVSNWREAESPRYVDFWSQNLTTKSSKVHTGAYKGEEYRYLVLRKLVLYPQKSGKLVIEPLSLNITATVPTKYRDFFGSRLLKKLNKTISTGRTRINVKPLPEEGKPEDFNGAVGDFNFKVTTNKKELNALEALEAKVIISGKGNLKLFQLPKLKVPNSLEVYEPEHNEKGVQLKLSGLQGKISDTYTIIPQYRGKYPFPSTSFSYFDLKTKSYKTIHSPELIIDVIEGPTNTANMTSSLANSQAIVPKNSAFKFIKTNTNLLTITSSHFFKSKGFWGALLLPFIIIPLAILIHNKTKERKADVFGNKVRKADRLSKKYLSKAKKTIGQKESFYIVLERALHNYLKAKLQIETSDLSKDKIEELLNQKQVTGAVSNEFLKLLKNCELARYTPITQVEMEQDYNKASETISAIDKQLR